MSLKFIARAAALAAALGATASAHSAIVTYTSLASFNANAGVTSVETFANATVGVSTAAYNGTFNGFTISSTPNGDLSGIATGRIAAFGDDTSTGIAAFYGQNFYGWGQSSTGVGTGSTAPTTLFATSFGGVSAIGFDFFNTDFTDSYRVRINGVSVATINTSSTGFLGFVGTGGSQITSLQIETLYAGGYISTAGIDNVRVSVSNSVPEPGSLALAGLALAAAGLSMRRKQR